MSEFQYDGRQRRRARAEFTWTNGAWAETNLVHYVYDGNLVLQERDQNNLPNVTYTRGNDLSGSLQGAGGVGGLLARADNALNQTAFYHADNHGNITMLINSSNAIVAKYLYDAFGNVLSASGSLANANVYRFSSKEAHANSGLDYFLFRFYDPNLQRWPNRDPIGETGFENLRNKRAIQFPFIPPLGEAIEGLNPFEFVHNEPTTSFDIDGLRVLTPCERAKVLYDMASEAMVANPTPANVNKFAAAMAEKDRACKDPPPPCLKVKNLKPPAGPSIPPVFLGPLLEGLGEGIAEWWWVVFA